MKTNLINTYIYIYINGILHSESKEIYLFDFSKVSIISYIFRLASLIATWKGKALVVIVGNMSKVKDIFSMVNVYHL